MSTSDQDMGTEDSQSQDSETENNESYARLTAETLANESLSDKTPYNSALRLAVTNEALFEMAEGWHSIARQMGNDYAASHPHYQRLFKELSLRGIISQAGHWLVDPSTVNLNFVRV